VENKSTHFVLYVGYTYIFHFPRVDIFILYIDTPSSSPHHKNSTHHITLFRRLTIYIYIYIVTYVRVILFILYTYYYVYVRVASLTRDKTLCVHSRWTFSRFTIGRILDLAENRNFLVQIIIKNNNNNYTRIMTVNPRNECCPQKDPYRTTVGSV